MRRISQCHRLDGTKSKKEESLGSNLEGALCS